MAINIADSFNRTTAQPPFTGMVFADITARDAYLTTLRYEGMECFVLSTGKKYVLVGGLLNANWVEGSVNEAAIALKLARATSTGVLDGLTLAVNVDTTKFNIATGIYDIADHTDINNPVITTVNYAGATGVTVTNLATQDVTYILLDAAGAITQQSTYPTASQRRAKAFVGRLNHSNRTNITFTNTFPDYKIAPVSSFYDLVDALAPFKMTNDALSIIQNGANLSFNRAAGSVFFRSDNYTIDKTNPHTRSFTAQILQPFRKMTRSTTVDVADVTVIEPNYYDVAGVRTLIPGANGRATIQRVYLYKSGAVRVAYGQNWYSSLNAALAAINTDTFVENPTVAQTAVLIGMIVVTKGCTDLTNENQCLFVPTSRFGGTGGGGGGGVGGGALEVSDVQTLANAAPVVIQAFKRQRIKIQSTGGLVTVTIPNGVEDGQELYIQGVSDANPCEIDDSANVYANGRVTFTRFKLSIFVWDNANTTWVIQE